MVHRSDEDRRILVVGLAGAVYGLDARTGEECWRNKLEGGGVGAVEVALGDGVVHANAMGPALHRLDYRTGETRWTATLNGGTTRSTILLEPDRIIVARGGVVECYDLRGNHRWINQLKGAGVAVATLALPGNVRQGDA